jgi:type I restriction enzyme, S subunit
MGYEHYVESDSPWLGAVPSHWRLSRFGYEAVVNGGQVDPRNEPWLSTTLVAPNHIEGHTGRVIARESAAVQGADSGKYLVRSGQVMYSKIRPALNKVAIATEDCLCSADMYAMSFRPAVLTKYAFYYMLARPFHSFATVTSMRVKMPKINREELSAVPWLVPPLDEQRAIADYLDRETAKVDTLIEEQQRLIETLRERRAALIEHTVARGLDSTVETKPSTLAWTDVVPAHWVVANIRRFATMKTGHTPSRSNPDYWVDCTIPWFTLADVWQLRDSRRTYLGDTANSISELGLANSAAELLPARAVVLSRTASVGFTGIMPRPMATSQDFWNWVCGPSLLPEFLVWTFRAMRREFGSMMIGSTHKTIYQPVAASIRIPVPPLDEQRRIVDYLDEQTAKIDNLVAESERFVELSRERRAALITAAVTGQFDVREQVRDGVA